MLVFLENEIFEDLLKILHFAVLAVPEYVIDDRVLQGSHDSEHLLTCLFIQFFIPGVLEHCNASNEIDGVLLSIRKRLRFSLLPLKLLQEGREFLGYFDNLVVLQVVEGRVDREPRIDRVLSLGETVVSIEYAARGQVFKREIRASIHRQEQLDLTIEDNYNLIIDLLIWILIHTVEQTSFLFDLRAAHVGQLHDNLLFNVRKVVNFAERSGQKEL